MTPLKIGSYRVESKLGTGGMGEVYRAVDERHGTVVAVKRVSEPMAKKGRESERLRREAQAVARLRHPAIVRLVELLEEKDGHWLVMELVEGRSLTRILRDDGPFDNATAVAVFHQVTEALAEAHEQGILHRDLKSDNLMVTPSGQAKLLDFGLALAIQPDVEESRLTIDGRILGTPHAMSPEQARGWDLDHRSDLFSLGTLLYEALTGVKPFLGPDPMESLRRVCFKRQKPARRLNPNVPHELSWLVDRLLEKEPRQRPQETREVVGALERLRADSTLLGAEPGGSPAAGPRQAGPRQAGPRQAGVRPEHLDLLHDRWRRARAGDGQLFIVSGTSGAGKSRLLATLQRRIRSHEMTWLGCCCAPSKSEVDFAPLLDLLRRLLGSRKGSSRDPGKSSRIRALETLLGPHAATTGVVREVAEMLEATTSSLETPLSLEPERRRRMILETFLLWLQELTEERPALVVFEELQWADPATLGLLDRLIKNVEGLPMLLVLTWQTGFEPPWPETPSATHLKIGV